MRKNFVDEWREEIRRMRAGESIVEECSGREAEEMEREKVKEVAIHVSKSTYTRLTKKAKRAKLGVAEFLEKLAGEK